MTTTLEQAAMWVAEATGLRWPENRAKVLTAVNDVRELLYDVSVFAWQTALTVPVRQFRDGAGIALPRFVANVLGVYDLHGRPVPTVDRWGVYPFDENEWVGSPQFQFTDMGEEHPFLTDPPVGCWKLSLLARAGRQDKGKVVTLRYLDANDIERTERLALGETAVETQYFIKTIEHNGVSLPTDLVGNVRATAGDTLLVEWRPWEKVPGYRRLKFVHDCRGACAVIVHAERRRAPLFDDTDPVETAQKLIWQDGARYLMIHNRTNSDGSDAANASKFLVSFTAKVEEAGRRVRGRTHKRALSFRSNTPRQSGLWRGR